MILRRASPLGLHLRRLPLYRAYTTKPPLSGSSLPPVEPSRVEDSTPSEPSTTSSQGLSPRLQKYAPRLAELSARTRVPLPALGLSFLALHEITAVVPIFLIYQVLHYLGAGVGLVAYLASLESEQEQEGERGLVKRFLVDWYESGSTVMEKVGRRYGILGYEKGSTLGDERSAPHGNAAAAVADAVGAYVITKALLPARLYVCFIAAPSFARLALWPFRKGRSLLGKP